MRRFKSSEIFPRLAAVIKTGMLSAQSISLFVGLSILSATLPGAAQDAICFVSLKPGLLATPKDGRLFVILSVTNEPEPRLALGRPGSKGPQAFAMDVRGFASGTTQTVKHSSFGYPAHSMDDFFAQAGRSNEAGRAFTIQALFDCNPDLRVRNAPGNAFSKPQRVTVENLKNGSLRIELGEQVPEETLPPDKGQLRFVKLRSKLLTEFYDRPIYLRAGLVLPRDFEQEKERRYPLWVRIGGLNTRYSSVVHLMDEHSDFKKVWMGDDTPRFVLLQVDGAGPLGDPYQINSANSGPYGDAITRELIPAIEQQFRCVGKPEARVLSGVSTGGWVCLALQIFYPDYFNGAWASCPDPVDFRSFEVVNIYKDTNAYVNAHGNERPSERDLKGDTILTMRQELGVEQLLGAGNDYALSGEQWGEWTATFSPRGTDGRPAPLWDGGTGQISASVAGAWKKYDLRMVLEGNWKTLAPMLRGKIHIASGEADQYFLNNAVHLLDDFLTKADPPAEAHIAYGPGKGHGWSNLSTKGMLEEMNGRVTGAVK